MACPLSILVDADETDMYTGLKHLHCFQVTLFVCVSIRPAAQRIWAAGWVCCLQRPVAPLSLKSCTTITLTWIRSLTYGTLPDTPSCESLLPVYVCVFLHAILQIFCLCFYPEKHLSLLLFFYLRWATTTATSSSSTSTDSRTYDEVYESVAVRKHHVNQWWLTISLYLETI